MRFQDIIRYTINIEIDIIIAADEEYYTLSSLPQIIGLSVGWLVS